MKKIIVLGIFLMFFLAQGQSQSLIIKSSKKATYVRSTIPVYKWQNKFNKNSFSFLGPTGVRLAMGVNDGIEIFAEGRINQPLLGNQRNIYGGNVALGIRYNCFKAPIPIEFPQYVTATFFSSFHWRPFNRNFGYFLLYKKSNKKMNLGAGISHRILQSLTLSLEATATWIERETKRNFPETDKSNNYLSAWIGMAFVYHIN